MARSEARALARALAERVLTDRAAPPYTADDVIAWAEQNFWLYDTGQLLTFYEPQRRGLQHALARDGVGHFIYHTVVWSWPKKSAKSTVIAALVDYVAEHVPRAQIKLLGNDQRQADSRVGFYVRESIRLAQRRGGRLGVKISLSGYHIDYPNGSRIDMLPIDPAGEAGGNDDLIVFSELWGWRHAAHQRMWEEMTLSPTKYGRAQRWIDTYAGFVGDSPVLEPLYRTGVVEGKRIDDDYEIYANESARLLCVWVTQPLLPWQTPQYYAEQASVLTPSAFARMHRNQWVTSESAFVPASWWDACAGELPSLRPAQPVVVGIDAGIASDAFAVVAVSRHGGRIAVREVHVWQPHPGERLLFSDPHDRDNPTTPEGTLRGLARRYNVVQFAYDEYQLHDLCTRLAREGVGWFRAFSQGAGRAIADKLLYDLIRDRRIVHNGDPTLRAHILNADARADGDKLRLVKRAGEHKIDAAVALSMAAHEALRLNLE